MPAIVGRGSGNRFFVATGGGEKTDQSKTTENGTEMADTLGFEVSQMLGLVLRSRTCSWAVRRQTLAALNFRCCTDQSQGSFVRKRDLFIPPSLSSHAPSYRKGAMP